MLEDYKNIGVLVAHPDDETLFAGGLLARFGKKCTVICCTIPLKDPIRADKFKKACQTFGAISMVLPYQEGGADVPISNFPILCGFDAIVSHNSAGEYGHLHHKQVHEYVMKQASVPIFTFCGDQINLLLSEEEQRLRFKALRCYDHVLPYGGRAIPKWQALIERYGELKPSEGYNEANKP